MRYAIKAGAAIGAALLLTSIPATAQAQDGTVLGQVTMGAGDTLSAAVFDAHGQLVRHLYELAPRSGTVTVRWDGKDDHGYDLPAGHYDWRALSTKAKAGYDGQVGDGGQPIAGQPFQQSEQPGDVTAVTFGADNDVYVDSRYEELQNDVRRIARADLDTGRQKWFVQDGWRNRGHAIALDDTYVYVAAMAQTSNTSGDDQYRIFRRRADNGAMSSFDQTDPKNPGLPSILVDDHWSPAQAPVTGLAVDSSFIWVSDTQNHQLRVYDKHTGLPANIIGGKNTFDLPSAPHGLAGDGQGTLWVALGSEVRKYHFEDGTLPQQSVITGLHGAYGLAWTRANSVSELYISETETGDIRRFDVSGEAPNELPQRWHPEGMTAAGTVTDKTVGWKLDTTSGVPGGDAAIAISADGATLAIVDYHNSRTLFVDLKTGKVQRLQGNNNPAPDVDARVGTDTLTSQGLVYHVDYAAPGKPWQLVANWLPDDDPQRLFTQGSSVIRKLNGQQFLYVQVEERCSNDVLASCADPGSMPWGGILVYRLNADGHGMKRVAQLKRLAAEGGPPYPSAVSPRLSITTDTDGDGVLGSPGDTSETTSYAGYLIGNPSVSVDRDGTIWMADAATIGTGPADVAQRGVGKLALHPGGQFDAKGNPVYKIGDFTVPQVGTYDGDSPGNITAPQSRQVVNDPVTGRIYAEADTSEFDQWANFGGNAVSIMDTSSGQKDIISGYHPLNGPRHLLRDSITGLAVDTAGGYFYTAGNDGRGTLVTMHTWDGLPIALATGVLPTYSPGYLDRGASLTAFTAPDGNHYAYAQDDGYGLNARYAFTGVASTQRWGSDPATNRHQGDFDWPGTSSLSTGLTGWWRLDGGRNGNRYVEDSSGGNHWGAYEGYPAAKWGHPDGGVHEGAFSFEGTATAPDAISFGHNSWEGKPDNLAGTGALSVATWFNTTASGVLAGYQNAWGREDYPKPTAASPALYIGQDGKLHGGVLTTASCAQIVTPAAVNDGHWHHAALVADGTGQTLYLDGKPAGHTNCARATDTLGFSLLGKGYTTRADKSVWPSTPGGYFHYTGLLDDVRMYSRTLTAAEVTTLATPPAAPGPLADWTFDATSGTTAPDATDHGKDGVVTAGTWQPAGGRVGGALAFDGTKTQVTLPSALMSVPPETVSVWVNTTKGGPVLGDQRGPFPTAMVPGWPIAERTSSEAIGISPTDGKVRSFFGDVLLGGKGPDLRDGHWHHIAVTTSTYVTPGVDNNQPFYTGVLYIDGQAVDQGPPNPNHQGVWSWTRANAQFGAARTDAGVWSYYTGLIDDARLYTRPLTAAEVNALAHP